MTPEVVELLRQLRPTIEACPRVALLSPGKAERALFPRARPLYRNDWDLDQPRRDLRFDLIIGCHVFHYARDPQRWLDNVTASCRGLLIADLVQRKRSPQGEFGSDGDCTRYAIGSERPSVPQQFDLNALGDALRAHITFAGAPNEYGPARHLLALIRGGLDAPLLHLRGYEVAQRAAPDLVDSFVERALAEALPLQLSFSLEGPSLQQQALFGRAPLLEPVLRSLAGEQPPGWVERLRAQFGQPAASALARLGPAKRAAEQALSRPIVRYASDARVGQRLAAELAALHFDLCLVPKHVGCSHPRPLRQDFSGLSRAYPAHAGADSLALDLGNEVQAASAGCSGWTQLLAAIAEQRRSGRARIDALARALPKLVTGAKP